jgi:hypothetical protein
MILGRPDVFPDILFPFITSPSLLLQPPFPLSRLTKTCRHITLLFSGHPDPNLTPDRCFILQISHLVLS